jgi:hypothetical protein
MIKSSLNFKSGVLITEFIFLIILLFISSFNMYSQCSNCNSNYPAGTLTTTNTTWTTISTLVYGGEYHFANLESGYIYQWNTEGTSYDTQLTLYYSNTCANTSTIWHPGPYLLAYNDDYNPPGNLKSLIAYLPGATSVRVLMSQYNCNNNTTSGTVKWRRIPNNPTISASNTSICVGQSVTLTASNISGDDDYIDIRWGTSSGGTEISSDAYSVNVSPTVTTTYYLQYFVKGGTATDFSTGAGINSNTTSITITVYQPPTAPTGITVGGAGSTICPGQTSSLTATGGTNGSGATFQWFAGGCGSGPVLGTGSSLNVNPTSTTTYYVRRVGTTSCTNITDCASTTIIVNTESTAPSSINAIVNP